MIAVSRYLARIAASVRREMEVATEDCLELRAEEATGDELEEEVEPRLPSESC